MSKKKDILEKNKRLIIVLSVTAVVVVILSYFMAKSARHSSAIHIRRPVKVITTPTQLAQQSWIAKAQSQLQAQREEIRQLKLQQKELKDTLRNKGVHIQGDYSTPKKQTPTNKANAIIAANQRLTRRNNATPKIVNGSKVSYPPPPPIVHNSYSRGSYRREGINAISGRGRRGQPTPPSPSVRQSENLIAIVSPKKQINAINSNKQQTIAKNITNNKPTKTNSNKPSSLIPPGSFVTAVLLTGADVPTSGGGATGTIPVLLRVVKDVQMPNLWKEDIKSCFLLGDATGSLSAERAYIRVTKLSCITRSGKRVETSVKGYVTGSDGKVGLSGRVVSKQGAMLARSLMAGFLQGIGRAFAQSETTSSISALGTTQSVAPDANTLARYSLGQGIASATNQVAKFYLKMANQMFPVIEVNAGRPVDVVFLEGVKWQK